MPSDWERGEVDAIVEDYFDMLRLELNDLRYNKAEHNRNVAKLLDKRSRGSIEFKHQNISAVLIEMGMPYIDGYKPRFNYQRSMLPHAVFEYISNHSDLSDLFERDAEFVPTIPSVDDILQVMESPPEIGETKARAVAESSPVYTTGKNYLEIEARNQSLGDAGEQFVLNFERARLIHAGKPVLADRIEQVSVTVGPSAGYDIRSYEINGTDRYIEAKTTKYGKNTPFFITPNELRFSEENKKSYHLYRLFRFRASPGLFMMSGLPSDHCTLKPSVYVAHPFT